MYKESLVGNKSELVSQYPPTVSAQALSEKFGTTSDMYKEFMKRLKELLEKISYETSIKAKLDGWTNTIRTLYGYKPNLSLLVDHTYLVILAKIVTYLKLNNNRPDKKDIIEVLSGKYFMHRGITNFVDDLTFWLVNSKIKKKSLSLLWTFVEVLSDYNFSRIEEDIFRELYEEIIQRRERHKAGEYYTPEWLVQVILKEVTYLWGEKKDKAIPKILDPACGSGAFIFRAIEILRRKKVSMRDILKKVEGVDINPIATAIAKANYLIAIADMIKNSDEITLPLYTGDSLKPRGAFYDNVKSEKYDIIIGNPPWVVMRSMKNKEYQNFLKKEILEYGLLEKRDVHLFTQMELATLFFCKCADLYLRTGGIISFVMPRSVLAGTTHHINFREFKNPSTKLVKVIDLENVSPLFNMPSCVLVGLKGGVSKYPVPLESYNGKLSSKNARYYEAKRELSMKISRYTPPDFSIRRSYYYTQFRVGASIFPRSLYFVDLIPSKTKSSRFSIRTSEGIYRVVKDPWKVILESNKIEEDFLYATLLAWEIIPFGYVELRPAVLPIAEDSQGYRLINISGLRRNGFKGAAKWFKQAQEIWDERKTKKSKTRFPSLLDRLNYNGLLTIQNPNKRYVVLYNATGTNLFSCVVDKHSLPNFEFKGKEITPRRFIVDVKTWFFETNNKMEAYYLCAIFNSGTINRMMKPFQPRGLFGARAIHRRPLLFPISQFNGNDYLHIKLANIAKKCHSKIKSMRFAQGNNIRAKVRNELKREIMEIDEILSEVIPINMEDEQNDIQRPTITK